MSFLKDLFKPKTGGTNVGNALRGITSVGATLDAVKTKIATPIVSGVTGVPKEQVEKIASLTSPFNMLKKMQDKGQITSKDANDALEVINQIQDPTTDNAKIKVPEGVKTVFNGIFKGAIEGGSDAFLNGTEAGKDVRNTVVEDQFSKYLPFGLGALVLYFIIKRK